MDLSKAALPIVLFLLTIASGFWVSKSGRPYPTGVFTVHKLIALGAVVFAVIAVIHWLKLSAPPSLIIALLVLAGISALALFVSGGLMSGLKNPSAFWLLIHRVAPFLLAGSASAAVWFWLKG